jgi:glycosyltransferase involved in cell wall biosynthesis
MGISVTIQTYNRAEELRRTLDSLARIDRTGVTDYEVIVVDNNSNDHTREVVDRFHEAFSGLVRYVRESRQGLSHARQRAVAESRYEVVAFLDDDVDVDARWLRAMQAAHSRGDFAVVGGRAHLVYPAPRPGWLADRSEGLLTRVELGDEARPAQADELFGVNLSVRKSWLEKVGGFRTDLGRMGSCLIGSEETDLLERIVQAGGRLLYEPGAVVGHRVPPERLRRSWFWSRCYWGARGVARQVPDSHVSAYQLLRSTWHVALSCGKGSPALLTRGPSSEEAFYHSRVLASRLGYCVGLARRWARIQPV